MNTERVGWFHVHGRWHVLCSVSYEKGHGYVFNAYPAEDMGQGVISVPLSVALAGRGELVLPAKRFSRKLFAQVVAEFTEACAAEGPRVMRHVAEVTERIAKERGHA